MGRTPTATLEEKIWEGNPSLRLLLGGSLKVFASLVLISVLAYWGHSIFVSSIPRMGPSMKRFFLENGGLVALSFLAVAALLLLPGLYGLVRTAIRIKSIRYTLTNQRILIETGLFSKALQEIDLRYVDETQFSQGFLERLLGVGEVRVASSDPITPRFLLSGVLDPRAVRERVRAAAYQVSQRQFFTRST